ncbi:PilZ domain-containing protein [Erythrobacter sp.]|uniref:PilZ domain-containing protein n=1 Tax=Erythrobacter sp. TaxID=1042 RepID=UPI002EB266DF|nr:PilZ domain-containing protein [Erythrobacter sp.]
MSNPFNRRREDRQQVTVYGRFRYMGRGYDIPLRDLSEKGCRFYDRYGRLEPGVQLQIRIADIGPFASTVRWQADHVVGVEFDDPIYGPVLDHIYELSR